MENGHPTAFARYADVHIGVIVQAWALKRGFLTAKAGRPDVYRAANDILAHAVDGRIVLALTPPGYQAPSTHSVSEDAELAKPEATRDEDAPSREVTHSEDEVPKTVA